MSCHKYIALSSHAPGQVRNCTCPDPDVVNRVCTRCTVFRTVKGSKKQVLQHFHQREVLLWESWYSTRSRDNDKILLFMSWSQSRAILILLESICILFDVFFFCLQVQAISKNVSECSTRTDYCLSWSCVCDTTQGWAFFLSEFSQTSEIRTTYLKRFWLLKCIRWFEKYHGSWL